MSWTVGQGPEPRLGNTIEFLVDNESAWGRLNQAVADAKHSVRCMVFMWDLPHVRMGFPGNPVGRPGAPGSVRLEETMVATARRGVEISLLLNDPRPSFSPANTVRQVERFFHSQDHGLPIRVRRLRTPQAVPIHAKLFLIDDRLAFSIGSVFAQEYFDSSAHAVEDSRRGQLRWRSSVFAPTHDVSALVTGPVVADLDGTFRLHWNHAGPDDLPPFSGDKSQAGTVRLQVTRSLHGARYAGLADGETGVLESYVKALERAERFVYLENQYLTSAELVDSLVRAMERSDRLELIILLNNRPDIPNYVSWQTRALNELRERLGADGRARSGIFTLWSHDRSSIIRTHVHSKLAIVDDEWLTVGSANLDGLSLLASQHAMRAGPLVRRLGRWIGAFGDGDPRLARATEVNLTCCGFEDGEPPAQIPDLRQSLWAEHLGCAVPDETPNEGWLALWRERAELKLAGLRSAPDIPTPPRVLPYPETANPVSDSQAYLRALGVDPSGLEVKAKFRSFSFRTGRWR